MLSSKTIAFAFLYFSVSSLSAPVRFVRREVPQEHSHEPFLQSIRDSIAEGENPLNLGDAVFGLLGNAAAAQGLGQLTDPDCLQQALADQAFTNAKAAGDVDGQVGALIYRALERNTGAVGQASNACTSVQAVNPEIAAIQQHQDPASDNAAAVNKAIVLELAKQIAAVGGDPQDALKSGTFAPGQIGDPTAAGNTCDDQNDPNGCIFTQNLLVEDATADEINAAVAGVSAGSGAGNATATDSAATEAATDATATDSAATETATDATATDEACSTVTVTVTAGAADATATAVETQATEAVSTTSAAAAATSSAAAAASGDNLQTFTGALGGKTAPAVTVGGRGFVVEGSDDFLNVGAALGRSCDIQHNQCANAANSGGGFSVSDCDQQNNDCHAAISA